MNAQTHREIHALVLKQEPSDFSYIQVSVASLYSAYRVHRPNRYNHLIDEGGWTKALGIILLIALVQGVSAFARADVDETEYPEAQEIEKIVAAGSPPAGVLFNVLEYEEDALEWIVPRLEHYVARLRQRFQDLEIVIVSHGEEIFALRDEEKWLYKDVHKRIQRLSEQLDVTFHVCGAYARANGIDESEFPQYVDVVPLATTQIKDYQELGYRVITTELSW